MATGCLLTQRKTCYSSRCRNFYPLTVFWRGFAWLLQGFRLVVEASVKPSATRLVKKAVQIKFWFDTRCRSAPSAPSVSCSLRSWRTCYQKRGLRWLHVTQITFTEHHLRHGFLLRLSPPLPSPSRLAVLALAGCRSPVDGGGVWSTTRQLQRPVR